MNDWVTMFLLFDGIFLGYLIGRAIEQRYWKKELDKIIEKYK